MSYFKQIKEISKNIELNLQTLLKNCKSFTIRQFLKDFRWFDLDNWDLSIKNHILKQKPIITEDFIRYNFEKSSGERKTYQ